MTRLLFTTIFIFIGSIVYAQYDFDVSKIPDSLLVKANSVIRHSHINLEMYTDKMIYKYDYAITALNKKHEEKLLFAAHYQKNENKIKDVKIKIYSADGQLMRKIRKKEVKEYGLQNIEFADDTRSLIYEHISPTYPVTIHVTYTNEIKSPFYVKTWYPIRAFRQSLESASIEILDHTGDNFAFQAHMLPDPIKHTSAILYFEYNQQKAFIKEKYMPSLNMCFPRLEIALNRLKHYDHVGKVKNWTEFGAWTYKEMFSPKQDLDLSFLKKETFHLIEHNDSELTVAQKLYKHIQETTRYVLISLEDGGWSPLATSTAHERKYGDCKALSFYYNTLCKAHGIDATLALVYAGESKQSAKEEFYSSSQFNHVISKLDIDGQTYWVDCTSNVDPFNFLGKFTDDRNVLLFDKNRGVITKTPEYKYIKKVRTSMEFTKKGKLEGKIDFETEGIGISRKLNKLPKMSAQELASYQKWMLTTYSNPIIDNYSYEFDTTNLNFKESFKIVCPDAGEKFGDHIKIRINRNELELPKFRKNKNRVWPIQFLRNKEYVATTKLKYDVLMVPILKGDVTLDSEFGRYSFSTNTNAGEIVIKRSLKLNKATYAKNRYNEIKSFFDKIKKIEKRSILLSTQS